MKIVRLFPDLLGTYGDDGNAVVLAQRARWRGIDAEILDVTAGGEVPDDGDVYTIGGGEDGPQVSAANQLAAGGGLHRAVERGAAVLAVCAGFQLLGHRFVGPEGAPTDGLGLLDATTTRTGGPRLVGEAVCTVDPSLGLPDLSGYENHAGITTLGPGTHRLGTVRAGHGNGDGSGVEGAWSGHVVATYLHGPVLARNAALADLLLCWALDRDELPPLSEAGAAADVAADALRLERIAVASRAPAGTARKTPRRRQRRTQ